MFTTDLALKFDPAYSVIAKRFHDKPDNLRLAFAKAWFKLTHRDMGPRSRYLGADVPRGRSFIWQEPGLDAARSPPQSTTPTQRRSKRRSSHQGPQRHPSSCAPPGPPRPRSAAPT